MTSIAISEESLQDIINMETGLLAPLTGFMGENDFRNVVDFYTLADGQVFTIPVTLDVPPETYASIQTGEKLALLFGGEKAAEIRRNMHIKLKQAVPSGPWRTHIRG